MSIYIFAISEVEIFSDSLLLKTALGKHKHGWISLKGFAPNSVEVEVIKTMVYERFKGSLAVAFSMVLWTYVETKLGTAVSLIDRGKACATNRLNPRRGCT